MKLKLAMGLLATCGISVAHAAESYTQAVDLYGVTFESAPAPWTSGDPMKAFQEIKGSRKQQGPLFLLEFVPAGEEFDSWKTMYAVKAVKAKPGVTMEMWKGLNLDPFKEACPGGIFNKMGKGTDKDTLVEVLCPKITGVDTNGYHEGMGEVGLFRFFVVGDVLISHYIEWRGDGFKAEDKTSWPVSKEEYQKGLAALKKAKAVAVGAAAQSQ